MSSRHQEKYIAILMLITVTAAAAEFSKQYYVPDSVLSALLQVLIQLILTGNFWGRYCYYSYL